MTRARRPGSRVVRRRRRVALLLVAAVLAIGISALAVQRSGGPRAAGDAAHAGHKVPGDPVAGTGGGQSVVLRERPARRLAAPVQDAAAASTGRGRVLIAGGLTAADTSRSDIEVVAPAGAAARGRLPVRLHDAAAVAIGGVVYVVGGADFQTSSTIYRVDPRTGRAAAAARLPVPMSDVAATVLRGTAYIVGGYTGSRWLDTVLAWRPGMRPHAVARLPQPLRYAAVTAAGGRVVVAGGSTPAGASRRVLALDPAHGAVRGIGLLPAPTTHAAAATLDGVAYVIGGRGATPGTPTDRIVAVDPGTGRVRAAGRLSSPRSDLAAVSLGGGVLLVGGRGAATEATVSRLVPTTHVASAARHRAIEPRNVYRADRAGALSPVVAHDPPRVYVPNSASDTVDVIDSRTYRVIGHFPVGGLPQHVVPSWDLRTLYVTNDAGNSLTPIDPSTGRRRGRPIRVNDPYNLYFTPDGRYAIVVAERNARLDFRDPHTMRLIRSVRVPCRGVDHMDFTADGHALLASCEFSGRLVSVDTRRLRVTGTVALPGGGMPQDVKLSPDGSRFYVADMMAGGVWKVDAATRRVLGFVRTGAGAHGLYPSRDARRLYVSNRGAGTVSVLSFATGRVVATWRIPGGSPDMGGVSADGRVLWLSGRYDGEVYAIDTRTGRLIARIRVGSGPHGVCVWPQPGRYSLGHTGILR
ncbi:MAG TPA: YncE family protein [Miltoncostaeaceae bacterium]|nr:YncE family protein [Miltoncostaeaceae bacterium]